MAIGLALEQEVGERRGRRNTDNCPGFGGRETRDLAAKRAGFGNAETYRQAKTVVTSGAPELIEAMDDGRVAISTAAAIATAPKHEQAEIVTRQAGYNYQHNEEHHASRKR